jgi:hypothetical protein
VLRFWLEGGKLTCRVEVHGAGRKVGLRKKIVSSLRAEAPSCGFTASPSQKVGEFAQITGRDRVADWGWVKSLMSKKSASA